MTAGPRAMGQSQNKRGNVHRLGRLPKRGAVHEQCDERSAYLQSRGESGLISPADKTRRAARQEAAFHIVIPSLFIQHVLKPGLGQNTLKKMDKK